MRSRQPGRVTVLILLVLWLSVWNALRLWTAVDWRGPLTEFALRPGPVYIAVSGSFWLALGLLVLWAMWRGWRRARLLYLAAALCYSAWYWADRLLFQQERFNWPFALAVNVLLIFIVVFGLRSRFFSERGT